MRIRRTTGGDDRSLAPERPFTEPFGQISNNLRSTLCYDVLTGDYPLGVCAFWGSGFWFTSVAARMEAHPGDQAYTNTPYEFLMTFFKPTAISNAILDNEAVLFHEALHGYSGRFDLDLEGVFKVSAPCDNITIYIKDKVLGPQAAGCQ